MVVRVKVLEGGCWGVGWLGVVRLGKLGEGWVVDGEWKRVEMDGGDVDGGKMGDVGVWVVVLEEEECLGVVVELGRDVGCWVVMGVVVMEYGMDMNVGVVGGVDEVGYDGGGLRGGVDVVEDMGDGVYDEEGNMG